MSQAALPFFDSDKAATKHAIQASGKTMKDVGHALWPQKPVERAQTDLLNALNDNRADTLSSDEHIFIANYCQRWDWLYYACHRSTHSRPTLQTPQEMSAQLTAAMLVKAEELEGVLSALRRLNPQTRPA